MYNEHNIHSNNLGLTLNDHCTICHFTILTPLESEPVSVPKPLLEIQIKEDTPVVLTFHDTSVIAIDRLRGPPSNI